MDGKGGIVNNFGGREIICSLIVPLCKESIDNLVVSFQVNVFCLLFFSPAFMDVSSMVVSSQEMSYVV